MKKLYILIINCWFVIQAQAQNPGTTSADGALGKSPDVLLITRALLAAPPTGKNLPAQAIINGKAAFSTTQYYARKVLQTQGDIQLTAGDKQIFRAGEAILLEPGFSVDSTAEFTAQIAAPEPEKILPVAVAQPAIADSLESNQAEARVDQGAESLEVEQAYGFTVFPNPADEILYVRYRLTEEAPVGLALFSMNGAVIQTLRSSAGQPAGAYELSFTLSAVPAGMYLVTLQIGARTFSQRLVVK